MVRGLEGNMDRRCAVLGVGRLRGALGRGVQPEIGRLHSEASVAVALLVDAVAQRGQGGEVER
jgi:hypothetical protein